MVGENPRKLPARPADPLHNIKIRDDIRVFRDDDCIFVSPSPLLGMAIRRKDLQLDLTPGELRIQREMERRRKQVTHTGVLTASVVMVISLLLLVRMSAKKVYLDQINNQD